MFGLNLSDLLFGISLIFVFVGILLTLKTRAIRRKWDNKD